MQILQRTNINCAFGTLSFKETGKIPVKDIVPKLPTISNFVDLQILQDLIFNLMSLYNLNILN